MAAVQQEGVTVEVVAIHAEADWGGSLATAISGGLREEPITGPVHFLNPGARTIHRTQTSGHPKSSTGIIQSMTGPKAGITCVTFPQQSNQKHPVPGKNLKRVEAARQE